MENYELIGVYFLRLVSGTCQPTVRPNEDIFSTFSCPVQRPVLLPAPFQKPKRKPEIPGKTLEKQDFWGKSGCFGAVHTCLCVWRTFCGVLFRPRAAYFLGCVVVLFGRPQ